MKAAVYLRVSTEEQRVRQSIRTQRDFAERYCALHEIAVYEYYSDDGVSGTIPMEDRSEGARLLQDSEDGKFGTVLVYRLDRLGREPRLILNTVAALESLKVRIQSMTEPFDTSSPSGRFMLTILSGVAGLERDTIIERSIAGTNRLARDGVWLGGIVAYGYRVVGEKKDARLVVSEEPLPGLGMTEAEVVRLIYRLTAEEHISCMKIADHLNSLGVPPSYAKDGRKILRGKRRRATAGIWRPGRVRNMIVNTTYKGIHQYGRRSKRQREIIEREVPSIVSVDIWERAQQVLQEHMLFSPRNAKRKYLLRGLMKCGLCRLTYIGTCHTRKNGRLVVRYVCNGKHQARGLYGSQGKRCPSKSVGGRIEDVIWQDVEEFLRHPGDVLRQLHERLRDEDGKTQDLHSELTKLQQALDGKASERDVVIGLFRRGRIDQSALDRQLDQIDREEAGLKERMEALHSEVRSVEAIGSQLRSAEDLLGELNRRLDEPLTWELKRELVEALVESIVVDTAERGGRREAVVRVIYRFDSTANRTGRGS